MRKSQFSLLGLFGVVSFVAVACAALARPNEWWALGVTNASLAALFVGALAAIYGHAARRAFWVGFAVVGWGYLVVGWANGLLSVSRPDVTQVFVTTRLLEWLRERTLGEATPQIAFTTTPVPTELPASTFPLPAAASDPYSTSPVAAASPPQHLPPIGSYTVTGVDPQAVFRFMPIGQSLWAIVLAVAGGLLARAFYFRRQRLAASAAASSG